MAWLNAWPAKFQLHNVGNPGHEAVSTGHEAVSKAQLTQSNLAAHKSASGELDDQTSSGETDIDGAESVATSAVTLLPTDHSTQRLEERGVNLKTLQAAKKHAPPESWVSSPRSGEDRWKVTYNGWVLITDVTKAYVITAFRDPSRAGGS